MVTPEHAVRAAVNAAFGGLSVLRGGRPFHPVGVAFTSTLAVDPEPPGLRGVPLFGRPRELAATVRISRSIGLPESWPDLIGAAVRVHDAHGQGRHQDLMFVTGGEGPLARHAFVPHRDYRDRTMSTILPFRVAGRLAVFLLRGESQGHRLRTLAEVSAAAVADDLSFVLALAPVLGGDPTELGRLRIEEPLPPADEKDLRFDTANHGGGINPAGFPNNLRHDAYLASQAARDRETPHDSGAERVADRGRPPALKT